MPRPRRYSRRFLALPCWCAEGCAKVRDMHRRGLVVSHHARLVDARRAATLRNRKAA